MKRLLATAAATLLVGGLAAGPAVADNNGKGKGTTKTKPVRPELKLTHDYLQLGGLATFQCTATAEDIDAVETVVESCEVYRGGVLIADGGSARQSGDKASTQRWAGQVPGRGDVTVCITGMALSETGEVFGHYICD